MSAAEPLIPRSFRLGLLATVQMLVALAAVGFGSWWALLGALVGLSAVGNAMGAGRAYERETSVVSR